MRMTKPTGKSHGPGGEGSGGLPAACFPRFEQRGEVESHKLAFGAVIGSGGALDPIP